MPRTLLDVATSLIARLSPNGRHNPPRVTAGNRPEPPKISYAFPPDEGPKISTADRGTIPARSATLPRPAARKVSRAPTTPTDFSHLLSGRHDR